MKTFPQKLARIKKIIVDDRYTDGDYWVHCGNGMIHETLDTFNKQDWEELKTEFQHFKDYELSIFADAILLYDSRRHNDIIDEHEVFFSLFILMNDFEDLYYHLENVMYVGLVKEPKLDLLLSINKKIELIELLSNNHPDQRVKGLCAKRKTNVDDVIEKYYR